MTNAANVANFHASDNSASFKSKQKITCITGNNGEKDVELTESLKYLKFFWKTLQMPLINCEINLILTDN